MVGVAGTFVDGERLAKRERVQVKKDSTNLTFGTCPAHFQVNCKHPRHCPKRQLPLSHHPEAVVAE